MPAPERIALLGLGLIGGSLGLALQRAGYAGRRVGFDPNADVRQRALDRGAVDDISATPDGAVQGADLVIVAAPVLAIQDLLKTIAPHLPPGCTVTDTASTKSLVLEWAAKTLPDSVDFVAGHPMAGREIQGIEGALPNLFDGCTYCLIPAPNASERAIGRVLWLIEQVGGRPLRIAPAEHDRAAAGISHLPLLLSAALVGATATDPEWPAMSRLAASGYRDVSRLASGDPRMGRDICLSNAAAITEWIDRLTAELGRLRGLIRDNDPAIEDRLRTAKHLRDAWIEHGQRV